MIPRKHTFSITTKARHRQQKKKSLSSSNLPHVWIQLVIFDGTQMSDPFKGKGSFRSKSRYWVDRNPRSRENVMRQVLEDLFQLPFPKVRPPFLLNPATRRRLELDAYCAELRLAAEFAGEQHRVFPNSCHDTIEEFERQQQRDRLKQQLCTQHAVTLLVVPDTVRKEAMQDYVRSHLIEMHVPHLAAAMGKKLLMIRRTDAAATYKSSQRRNKNCIALCRSAVQSLMAQRLACKVQNHCNGAADADAAAPDSGSLALLPTAELTSDADEDNCMRSQVLPAS